MLLGQRLTIHGSKGPVVGVVGAKPPHFLSADEREQVQSLDQMYIDIGASSRSQVEEAGICVGDAICPDSEFSPLAVPGRIRAKAIDNRVGVALMCRALQQLKGGDHPNTVVGVGAVQEEVGCRGAATAVTLAQPDLAIVLECTPADDTPGFEEPQARLGKGPQLRLYDPTAIAHRGLAQFVIQTAKAHDIPLQIAVRRSGGTDAKSIHVAGAGIPAVVIGVPGRYIHTHNSILDEGDVEQAERLVMTLLNELDSQKAKEICRVD